VIELDGAFAVQALAVLRELNIPDDAVHVDPTGGAIALRSSAWRKWRAPGNAVIIDLNASVGDMLFARCGSGHHRSH
jgi:hypothetical protein